MAYKPSLLNLGYLFFSRGTIEPTQIPRKHPETPRGKVIDYWEFHRKTRSKTAAMAVILTPPQSPRESTVIPPQSSAIPTQNTREHRIVTVQLQC